MFPVELGKFILFVPVYGWFFLGIGVPWAMALLPRDNWRDKVMIVALGLALGPLLGTTCLFFIGTFGEFSAANVLGGTLFVQLLGMLLAWRRRTPEGLPYTSPPDRVIDDRFSRIEQVLLMLLGLGLVVHILNTMSWPFFSHDVLWTYGYDPSVYFIFGRIPEWIQYYPKLLHLTYYFSYAVNGDIDVYAARVAIPWFMLGNIAMVYVFGSRLWGQRSVGLIAAAIFFLMPNAYWWSFTGDLEHPVTLYFTGATTFLILAWRQDSFRYAVIAGLLFAGAAWTKPTAGAWALGVTLYVILVGAAAFLPAALGRFLALIPDDEIGSWVYLWQKFRIAAITGLASIPMGTMWYLRNVALDHDAIILPPDFYHDLAQRSGQEFGWLILIGMIAVSIRLGQLWPGIRAGSRRHWQSVVFLLTGMGLLMLATLPSAVDLGEPMSFSDFLNWMISQRGARGPLTTIEVLFSMAGIGLLIWHLRPLWLDASRQTKSLVVMSFIIILPFAVVWFWNFSYDFRLMIMITPVLATFVAILLAKWVLPIANAKTRLGVFVTACSIGLGLIGPLALTGFTANYVVVGNAETDEEKIEVVNGDLIPIIRAMRQVIKEKDGDLVVYTVNEYRINYFFPEIKTIYRWERPASFQDISPDTDIVIGGSRARDVWEKVVEHYPNQLSAYMELSKVYSGPPLLYQDDIRWVLPLEWLVTAENSAGTHHLEAYAYDASRHTGYTVESVRPLFQFGNATWKRIAVRGGDIRDLETNAPIFLTKQGMLPVQPGQDIFLQLYWQRTGETAILDDYRVIIQICNARTDEVLAEIGGAPGEGRLPLSLLPYPDLLPDRRRWSLPDSLPTSQPLALKIILLDPESDEPLNVYQDGIVVDTNGVTADVPLIVLGS